MDITGKYNDLIGIPYNDGFNCWSLVEEIYKRNGITLCDHAEVNVSDEERHGEVLNASLSGRWEELEVPKPLCIIVFKVLGWAQHVGVYLGRGLFIHSRKNIGVVVEKINSIQWQKRITGFWEYADSNNSMHT